MMIGQLEAETGIPASTIRYWERIGVLPRPLRVAGLRRYGPEAVHYLAVLRVAQACGFRLNEMRHLLTDSDPPFRLLAAGKNWHRRRCGKLDEQMAQLKAMRRVVNRVLQCQCVELPECGRIAASVMEQGAE